MFIELPSLRVVGWCPMRPRPEAAEYGRSVCLESKFIQSLDDWMNFVKKKTGTRQRRIPIY